MKLLKYEGYNLTFEPELLTLKVFKQLHSRDRTKDKSRFLQELGYIYFMEDPRSDYQYITNPEERTKAIIKGEGLPKTWKVDALLQEAIDYYKTFKPTSALLLEDTRTAVDKLREQLRDIDLSAKDDTFARSICLTPISIIKTVVNTSIIQSTYLFTPISTYVFRVSKMQVQRCTYHYKINI